MDLMNFALAFLSLIVGSLIVRFFSRYLNGLRDNRLFKQFIKGSGYSEVFLWYASYFIKVVAYVVIVLIAIGFLGFAPQVLGLLAVILSLSIIGVLVYSLRDVLPSAFAGAYLLHSRVIKKGDSIKVDGFSGVVKDVSLLVITINDSKGSVIIVPNKVIVDKILSVKK